MTGRAGAGPMLRMATPSSFFMVSASVMLYFFVVRRRKHTGGLLEFVKPGFGAPGHDVDGIQLEVQSRQFLIDNGMLCPRDGQVVVRFLIADVGKGQPVYTP